MNYFKAIEIYKKKCDTRNLENYPNLIFPGKVYIPGYNYLRFMSNGQSLIDGIYYKKELSNFRKNVLKYARYLTKHFIKSKYSNSFIKK